MWCGKCNKDLSECICSDLQERLRVVVAGGHFAYKKCAICNMHYAKCKCENPKWIIEGISKCFKKKI